MPEALTDESEDVEADENRDFAPRKLILYDTEDDVGESRPWHEERKGGCDEQTHRLFRERKSLHLQLFHHLILTPSQTPSYPFCVNTQNPVLVEIRDVHKSYELGSTTVPALRGVDLVIRRGEFTALIGSSGSGKSTLLNLIGCLDEQDSGQIDFLGTRLGSLSEKEKSHLRNQKIGFIFQSFNLIPVLDVRENVEIPLTIRADLTAEEKTARVDRAIADVGLQEFAHHRPTELSGGQRQRVAIARALVTDPVLILADEPTANLDSKTAHVIIDLMLELNKKKKVTFFFCSHDEKLINRVERIIRISDGKIQS